MGGAIFSKSLIQISVDGWRCFPSLLFTCVQAMVEVMKIMATFFKMSHACTATLSAPSPLSRPLLTHDSWTLTGKSGSVSCGGHCSFLLGPGAQGSVFAQQEFVSQSCVSSGKCFGLGLIVTSSKRAYAIPRSAAARAPVPETVHC